MVKYTILLLATFLGYSCQKSKSRLRIIGTEKEYKIVLIKDGFEAEELFSIDNMDKTIEIDDEVIFYKQNLKYGSFVIYESAVGTVQSFIHNYESGKSYLSEVYDSHAIGDSIVLESFNEQIGFAEVVGGESNRYFVSFDRVNQVNIHDFKVKDFEGIWFLEQDSNAVFEISKDSIFYVDEMVYYTFEIGDDRMKIKDGENVITFYKIIELSESKLKLVFVNGEDITLFKTDE